MSPTASSGGKRGRSALDGRFIAQPDADMQCGHSHQECEQVRAENERLRKPDLRMMYGYELGIEDGKAERDALAAKVARVRALVRLLYPDEMTPTAKRELDRALDTPEGNQ